MASHDHHDDVFREFGKQFDADSKAHAHDEPKLGGEVPAGIKNGIAQLMSIKIDRYKTGVNEGKPYGSGAARIVFPEHAPTGEPVIDLIVRFGPLPLCDTGTGDRFVSAADNLGVFQMELKKLLGKSASPAAVTGSDALKKTIAYLNATKPYTRFKTWAFGKETIEQLPNGKWAVHIDGQPSTRNTATYPTEEAAKKTNPYAGREPRVNCDWQGKVDWKEPDAPAGSGVRVAAPPPPHPLGDDIEGATGVQPESAKVAARIVTPPPTAPAKPPAARGRKPATPPPPPEPEPDVNELADKAVNDPDPVAMKGAQAKLTDLAKAAGVPEDADGNLISEDASWQDVADRIVHIKNGGNPDGTDGGSGGDGNGETTSGVYVGGLYIYTSTNKQGRTVEKEVECIALFDGGASAEIKDNQTGKVLMDPKDATKRLRVPAASLSPVPV